MISLSVSLSACGAPEVSDLGAGASGDAGADTVNDPTTDTSLSGGAKVGDYLSSSCTTSVVRQLSIQLITELDCLKPGAVSEIPASNQIDVGSTFDYLQTKPAYSLPQVAAARSGTLQVSSALRSLAQQYLLYSWYQNGRCGISLAATPGNSNHERGMAVDVGSSSYWRSAFQNRSWGWQGSSDPMHYNYNGSGTINISGASVMAFQRLWNLNNPNDTISEDGAWGPQTAARVRKSPANGFPIGNSCGAAPFSGYQSFATDTTPDTCAL